MFKPSLQTLILIFKIYYYWGLASGLGCHSIDVEVRGQLLRATSLLTLWGARDRTQVVRIVCRMLLSVEPSQWPSIKFFKNLLMTVAYVGSKQTYGGQRTTVRHWSSYPVET